VEDFKERFYRVTHACGSGFHYTETHVYFRWPCKLPTKKFIIEAAVEQGEMLDTFLPSVVDAREITAEEYYTYMLD
jgi:hypothetical protein